MTVQRGEVVLLDYPYSAGGGSKVRPALVVQNDIDNRRLANTIVVQITSVTHRALQPTQVLIDLGTPAGRSSGLRQDSVVNCVNILTLHQGQILRKLGQLSTAAMQDVDAALLVALGIQP